MVAFFWLGNDTVFVKWLVVFGSVAGLVFLSLGDFAIRSYHTAIHILPKVKAVIPPPSNDSDHIVLVLDKSALFGHGSVVSIYLAEDCYEILMGIGYVITVQDDGHIQVLVTKQIQRPEIWTTVKASNSGVIKSLRVKPTLPFDQLIELTTNLL